MTRTGERILIGATIVALLIALVIPLTGLAVDGFNQESGVAGNAGGTSKGQVPESIPVK
jgi:hypothetical protein